MNKPTSHKVHLDKKHQDGSIAHNRLSFLSGFGHSTRLWGLVQIIYNRSPEMEQRDPSYGYQAHFDILSRPSILFGLALTFLNLGFRSILGRAKACLGKLWYPFSPPPQIREQ